MNEIQKLEKLLKLKEFRENRQGAFWVIIMGVITIIVATMTWLVIIVVSRTFVNTFSALSASPVTIQLGQSSLISGSIVVVVIDVGMVVWMLVSAFKREDQTTIMENY